MILTDEQKGVVRALREASASDFATLVALAGLDPSRDFRHANLRGVDFGAADLAGFDFTGADLTGADMSRASKAGAVFGDAGVGGVDEEGAPLITLRPYQRRAVEAIVSHLQAGHQRAIATMALGTGKSTVLAAVVERLSKGRGFAAVLVIVRDLKLVDDLVKMFRPPSPRRAGALGGVNVMFCEPGQLSSLSLKKARTFSHIFYLDVGGVDRLVDEYIGVNGARRVYIYGENTLSEYFNELSGNMNYGDIVFRYGLGEAIHDGFMSRILRTDKRNHFFDSFSRKNTTSIINDVIRNVVMSPNNDAVSILICNNNSEVNSLIYEYNNISKGENYGWDGSTEALHYGERRGDRSVNLPVFVYPCDRLSERDLFGVMNVAVLSDAAPMCVIQDWSVPIELVSPGREARLIDYTGATARPTIPHTPDPAVPARPGRRRSLRPGRAG